MENIDGIVNADNANDVADATHANVTMNIKANKENHTITWLKRMDDEDKLNKSISIQRKEVWDTEKKSNLIVSILLNVPIESLLFEECAVDTAANNASAYLYNVLDGKQRTLTVCAYMNDEFALSNKIRAKRIGDVNIVGKKYSELPENMRSTISEYELPISILRPLSSDERALVFFMRNQVAALTKMDLSRVMLGEDNMNTIDKLCGHSFFKNKVKLTEPARRKHEDAQLLLQYILLCQNDMSGLSGKAIMNLCDDIKNQEVELDETSIADVLDYLDNALTEKKQYLKKVQIPIVMFVAKLAKEVDMPAADFGEKLDMFFYDINPNCEYMQACKSGSAKKSNVQRRLEILSEAMIV